MTTGNTKKFELKIGKTGIIIVVAGMTALLCSSFLFGVDVGKNIDTYPWKIAELPQRALALVWRPARIKVAQSSPDKNAPAQESPTPAAAATPPTSVDGGNIDLTYYDTLTSKKGSLKTDQISEKPLLVPEKSSKSASQGNFVIESQKTQENAKNNVVSKNEAQKERTASSNNASGNVKFIVQAASLKDKSKANQVNKKIASLGFKSEIVKAEVKGKGVVFRVIASGFDGKDAAEKAAKKITGKTGTSCIIKKMVTQ